MNNKVQVQTPNGIKEFQMIEKPSFAALAFVRENADAFKRDGVETDAEYSERLYVRFFGAALNLNSLMQIMVVGDHASVDWYANGDILQIMRVFSEFWTMILPQIEHVTEEMKSIMKATG